MGCLQRQFGKDFHKLEFFIYNSIPRTHMVDKSLALQWKVLSVKWLKSPIAVRGIYKEIIFL